MDALPLFSCIRAGTELRRSRSWFTDHLLSDDVASKVQLNNDNLDVMQAVQENCFVSYYPVSTTYWLINGPIVNVFNSASLYSFASKLGL